MNKTQEDKKQAEEKSITEKIKEAKELLDSGVITQEEFDVIKKKIIEQ